MMSGIADVSVAVIGTGALVLLAIWVLWQLTIHLGALFGIWGRMIVWYGFRSRCTCEASDMEKHKSWSDYLPNRRWGLRGRGNGLF